MPQAFPSEFQDDSGASEPVPPTDSGQAASVCYDSLTGHPNRLLFRDQVNLAMRRAARDRSLLAVLSIDIDLAQAVSGEVGADFSDRLLRALSVRIGHALRAEDLAAARLAPRRGDDAGVQGGGGFSVLLPCVREPQDAVRVAARILESVTRPLQIDGHALAPSLHTGIALFPWDDQEVDGLLHCADAALERACQAADGHAQFFSKPMNALSADRLALENALQAAVEGDGFVLYYQPRVDGETRQVISNEALIRWDQPGRGLAAPGSFLDVAEQSRLILSIGAWVIQQACHQNRAWQDDGLPAVPVSVNVSAVQFRDPGFVASVSQALKASGMAPELLELEITESVLMNEAPEATRILRELKALGIRLAIDNFGTGFSSLAYLKDFPVDVLKIDRSFITDMNRQPASASVACAVIDLANRLGLAVVAEGVETQEQRRFLLENRCRAMHGFLFARPMPADALAQFHRESAAGVTPERKIASILVNAPAGLH